MMTEERVEKPREAGIHLAWLNHNWFRVATTVATITLAVWLLVGCGNGGP